MLYYGLTLNPCAKLRLDVSCKIIFKVMNDFILIFTADTSLLGRNYQTKNHSQKINIFYDNFIFTLYIAVE